MQLDRIAHDFPKVPELVMRALIAALNNGSIHLGSELPPERDLAENLGVGRGSLRECLAILEFLGAIENRGNRKIVTRDADYIQKAISFVRVSNQADTQMDLVEFRRINETAIVGLACQRATEEDLAAILEALQFLEKTPNDYMGDVYFHDKLAIASHNAMLAATIHLINSMIAETRIRFFEQPGYLRRTHESHAAIYKAVCDRDKARAQLEMEKHLAIIEEFAGR